MGNVTLTCMESPAVSRLVILGYPILSFIVLLLLIGIPTLPVATIFGCSLQNIFKLYLWTLATSSFYEPIGGGYRLLSIFLQMFMGMQYFPRRERELGSFRFLLWIILAGVVVNLMFLAIMAALIGLLELLKLDESSKLLLEVPNFGMWPLVIAVMSLDALSNPGGTVNFWGVIQIPNKWYPVFFAGIFMLLNQRIMWNLVAGLAVGYAIYVEPRVHFERLIPSQARIGKCDQKCCGQGCTIMGGAWLAPDSTGYVSSAYQGSAPSSQWARPQQPTPARGGGSSALFTGAGNRLGSGAGPAYGQRHNLQQALLA